MGSVSGYSGINNPPRSSGLARMSVILFSYFLLQYLITKSKNKNNYKTLLIISFFAICVNIFQSRTVSFIYLSTNILLVVFYYKKIILNKKILLFTIFIPIIFNIIYNYIKYEKGYSNVETLSNKVEIIGIITKDSLIRNTNDKTPDSFSSGRFRNWEKSYKKIILNPLVGYGAQSDRIYLNQSVHNGLIYIILSGGLIAGLFFILIQIRFLIFFIRFIVNRNYKKDFFLCFSILLLLILLQRSILETSLAVFSIDYLFYILSYLVIKNKLSKNN